MQENISTKAAYTLLTFSICTISYCIERSDSLLLIGLFLVAFAAYGYLNVKSISTNSIIFFGIAIRFALLFSVPNLSDDFYRFIWDGRLLNHSVNPFLELPSFYVEKGLYGDFLTEELYQQLNSQQYFTVYPPVLQAVFFMATWLFPTSILGSVVVMKVFLFAFEIGSIVLLLKLLRHFKSPERNLALYALNPVVILEIVGNIHFEGAMIFFSLLAVWLLIQQKWLWSAASMGVAIVAKLLPLMFLPFLIKRMKWKSIPYYTVVGVTVLLLFFPLLNMAFLQNISESVSLYFKSFEYNGSIYYVLRWIGYQIEGYNMIGYLSPWLSLGVAILVFRKALKVKELDFRFLPQNMLFAMVVFYFCSTTVHPWYITSMVAFGTLTRFRFPMLWSGLIFLTYWNYGYEPFRENMWIVAMEYVVLLFFIGYEVTFFKKNVLIKRISKK